MRIISYRIPWDFAVFLEGATLFIFYIFSRIFVDAFGKKINIYIGIFTTFFQKKSQFQLIIAKFDTPSASIKIRAF